MTSAAPPDSVLAREHPVALDGLFGWISPGTRSRGVILCGTYGYEQHCAHRPWRELALAIAATGCTVLRFSYPGTGDSTDVDADRLDGWTGSIRRGIAHLRADAGCDEIVLVGLRLGGTLAALVAAEEAVDKLVLVEPFVTGRAFLREMALQARVVDVLPDGRPLPVEREGVSVGGFVLHQDVAAALRPVSLIAAERVPAPAILIMGAAQTGLIERYRALGADVATAPFPDLDDLCANALTATMSAATREVIVAFAGQGALHGQPPRMSPLPPVRIEGPNWCEEPVRFGADAFAIHCRPRGSRQATASVLVLNMGLHVHSGLGRQATDFARRLAPLGVQSLRIDLRGVGDSPDRSDGALTMYDLAALDDVRAAIDLIERSCAGPLLVLGTCSGAYLAFHAACRDPRIDGAVLVNLYCFDWALTHGDSAFSTKPIRSFAAYTNLVRHRGARRRMLNGETPVFTILAALARRRLQMTLAALRHARTHGGGRDTIPQRIARLRARGARLALLYSDGDLGLADLHARLGDAPAEIDRLLGTPVRIVEGADHVFCAPKAQAMLFDALQAEIAILRESRGAPAGRPAFRPVETQSAV